jgi:hypothetical protein
MGFLGDFAEGFARGVLGALAEDENESTEDFIARYADSGAAAAYVQLLHQAFQKDCAIQITIVDGDGNQVDSKIWEGLDYKEAKAYMGGQKEVLLPYEQ